MILDWVKLIGREVWMRHRSLRCMHRSYRQSAEHSCVFNVSSAVGKRIVTVEGLSADADGQMAQAAWIAKQVPQCGYCQPEMLMATVGAMKAGNHGREIASEIPHVCVCGTYQHINAAIQNLYGRFIDEF